MIEDAVVNGFFIILYKRILKPVHKLSSILLFTAKTSFQAA